jgi:MarR family transcriptional regulator, 2-MHQ and catechol-resistance regulon repressor
MSNENSRDESADLLIALMRSYNWVVGQVNQNILRYGLIPTEFGILELLYHKGSLPLQQIGEKILISSGNLTYIVDKLEKKELLVRKPSSTDRRVIYAELTIKGNQFISDVFPHHKEVIKRAVNGLDSTEMKMATDLLKKLGRVAEEGSKKADNSGMPD